MIVEHTICKFKWMRPKKKKKGKQNKIKKPKKGGKRCAER